MPFPHHLFFFLSVRKAQMYALFILMFLFFYSVWKLSGYILDKIWSNDDHS